MQNFSKRIIIVFNFLFVSYLHGAAAVPVSEELIVFSPKSLGRAPKVSFALSQEEINNPGKMYRVHAAEHKKNKLSKQLMQVVTPEAMNALKALSDLQLQKEIADPTKIFDRFFNVVCFNEEILEQYKDWLYERLIPAVTELLNNRVMDIQNKIVEQQVYLQNLKLPEVRVVDEVAGRLIYELYERINNYVVYEKNRLQDLLQRERERVESLENLIAEELRTEKIVEQPGNSLKNSFVRGLLKKKTSFDNLSELIENE